MTDAEIFREHAIRYNTSKVSTTENIVFYQNHLKPLIEFESLNGKYSINVDKHELTLRNINVYDFIEFLKSKGFIARVSCQNDIKQNCVIVNW